MTLIVRAGAVAELAIEVAALGWVIVVLPLVGASYMSLVLAVPLIFIASPLQANHGTIFICLAFNMLFAVLSQPVRLGPTNFSDLALIEARLITGIF